MLAFAIMDGLAKILSQSLPVPQIMWVRNIFFTAVAIALLANQTTDFKSLATSARPILQFSRGLLLVLESAAFMVAFKFMPLADVHAVAAASPLIVVALSVPILGEKVGPRRWAAVVAGFVGVLLIIRPGFEKIEPPILIALTAAVLWGSYQIILRYCARFDRTETTTLWTAVVGLGATSVVGPPLWVSPETNGWILLIAIAMLGCAAHIAMIKALATTEAALLQPYSYTLFIWAVVVGYVMFGHIPDRWTLAGAAIIIISGIYAWHRERVRKVEPQHASTSRP